MPNKKNNKKNKPAQKVVVVQAKPKQKKRRRRAGSRGGVMSEVGSLLGFPKLGKLGDKVVSSIFGRGDYITNAPRQNTLMGQGPPTFTPLTTGFRIAHREYIRDVSSSTEFASSTYHVNPGLSDLFPWLSTVAANFEEYIIHGMVIYLNTTSGTAVSSTNTALGLWGAVTQYDPDDPSFTNKQQCENYVGCQTAVPFHSLMHGIECAPKANVLERKYVRTGDIAGTLKFHDQGKFQYFSQGSQGSNTIGEMWVSYDIAFYKPRLPQQGFQASADKYFIVDNTITPTRPFGSYSEERDGNSTLGTTISGDTITFPAHIGTGLYMIYCYWFGGANYISGGFSKTYSGSIKEAQAVLGGTDGSRVAPETTLTTVRQSLTLCVEKTDVTEGAIKLTTGGLAATQCIVIIARLPNSLNNPLAAESHLSKDELTLLRELLKKSKISLPRVEESLEEIYE